MAEETQDRAAIATAVWADAINNLRAMRGRSLFAVLGIAIGAAAVISILHVGYDARAQSMRQFQAAGPDLVFVQLPGGDSRRTIRVEDIAAMRSAVTGLTAAVPMILGQADIIAEHATISPTILATTPEFRELARLRTDVGRFLSTVDGDVPFVVLGADIARQVAAARHGPVKVGDRVTVKDQLLTVVGVLAEAPGNPLTGMDYDRSLVVSLREARRLFPAPSLTSMLGRMSPDIPESAIAASIATYLKPFSPGDPPRVQVASELISGIDAQMAIYRQLLWATGTVAFVIGGIGIMNVMLMNVLERQQEIGLRMAIGCTPRQITAMILVETTILSCIGCVVGIALGIVTGWVYASLAGWVFEFAPSSLPIGGGMALATGVLFGLYPATRAAALSPIQALRGEWGTR